MEQETNQDAQQDITSQGKPPQVLSIIGFFLIFVIILAGLVAVGFLALKAKNLPESKLADFSKALFPTPSFSATSPSYISTPQGKKDVIYKVQFTGKLESDIPTVFIDSKYKQIVSVVNSFQNEPDQNKKYQDSKTAFQLISSAYKDTKNPDFFLALLEVRSTARNLDSFQESDMPLPNE